MVHRVVQGGALHEPGQQRRLGQRQVCDPDMEVVLGGGTDTVVPVTEVGDVEVAAEDLVLGEGVLQRDGIPGFLDLALERRPGRVLTLLLGTRVLQQHVLDVLLGQRRGALLDVARLTVAQRRPGDPLHVHPAMGVETRILDGDDGLPHDPRDGLAVNHGAVLLAAQRRDETAVSGEDGGALRKRRRGELGGQSQVMVGRCLGEQADRADHR